MRPIDADQLAVFLGEIQQKNFKKGSIEYQTIDAVLDAIGAAPTIPMLDRQAIVSRFDARIEKYENAAKKHPEDAELYSHMLGCFVTAKNIVDTTTPLGFTLLEWVDERFTQNENEE